MKSGWQLGRWLGIEVVVHWTFLLLVSVLAVGQLASGASWPAVVGSTLVLAAVFVCVLLHEFGHALMARLFGIRTQDIILLPIGGLARLERMPEHPWQEFWIALAGPAVNVVIIAILVPLSFLFRGAEEPLSTPLGFSGFWSQLIATNMVLVIFNLLPAFPMDGGRVLRALLAMRLPYEKATQLAAAGGQAMAVLFAVVGLFTNWTLILVAAFVFLAARSESQQVQRKSLVGGASVREAMARRFRGLPPDTSVAEAVSELLADHQQDFPVVDRGRVVGVVHRADLLSQLGQGRLDATLRDVMGRSCIFVDEAMPLEQACDVMQRGGHSMLPVFRGHSLVGVLTRDNVEEWLMIRAALSGWVGRSRVAEPCARSLPA
ncbi:MAG: M50 family metallopeptidase [Pirellulaceae bacterium]